MFYAESIKHGVKAVTPSVNHTIDIRYSERRLVNGVVFKTQVLHFRVKTGAPLKDTNGKVRMNVQFSFCGLKKAFGYEIVLRGIQQCFLPGEAQDVLF